MIGFYKWYTGSNNEPSVRVSARTDEFNFENPVQFVEQAGDSFENATQHDLFIFNDSLDINHTSIIVLSIDHDTSDGSYQVDWFEFRLLNENTGTWSDWTTVLDVDEAYTSTGSGGGRTLYYYKEASPSEVRDFIHIQARVKIPYLEPTSLKDDISISLRADTEENLNNNGRP